MCFAIGTFSQEFTRGGTKDVQIYLEETIDDDPVLLGVTFIVFFILNLSPGDPAAMILGDQASAEALEMKREELGLNDPLVVRYGRYVVNMVQGDLGTSYKNDLSVWDQVMERFPNTAVLAVAGILVA